MSRQPGYANVDMIDLESRLRDLHRAIRIAAHLSNNDVDDDDQVSFAINAATAASQAALDAFYGDDRWRAAAVMGEAA